MGAGGGVCERQTDRWTDSHQASTTACWFYQSFLQQALWPEPCGREGNQLSEKGPVLMISPFVYKLRLHHQPVQTKQLWTQRTCVWIGNPKPAEEKKDHHSSILDFIVLCRWLQNSGNALPRGNQVLLLRRVCSLGSLSLTSFRALPFLPLLIGPCRWRCRLCISNFGIHGCLLEMQNFRPFPRPPESESAFAQNPSGFRV